MAEYVYGVVEANAGPPSAPGIAGAPVRTLADGEVAALISGLADGFHLGRHELLIHASVLEAALARGTVLPVRFGTVLRDVAAIHERLLRPRAAGLREQLTRLRGKVELQVRAMYERKPLLKEVVREQREIADLRAALRGKPASSTYPERVRLAELISRALERKRECDAWNLVDQLTAVASAVEISESRCNGVALSASFLVDRDRLDEFDAAVDRVASCQAERMRLRYRGPLPPHSFLDRGGGSRWLSSEGATRRYSTQDRSPSGRDVTARSPSRSRAARPSDRSLPI